MFHTMDNLKYVFNYYYDHLKSSSTGFRRRCSLIHGFVFCDHFKKYFSGFGRTCSMICAFVIDCDYYRKM